MISTFQLTLQRIGRNPGTFTDSTLTTGNRKPFACMGIPDFLRILTLGKRVILSVDHKDKPVKSDTMLTIALITIRIICFFLLVSISVKSVNSWYFAKDRGNPNL